MIGVKSRYWGSQLGLVGTHVICEAILVIGKIAPLFDHPAMAPRQ